jgi:hypothetical protein
MKTFSIIILAMAIGSPAAAQDRAPDPMAAAFGNTIEILVPPLWSARQYIDPDHTWRQIASDGAEVRGTWKAENGQGCLTQTQPAGPTYCHPLQPRKVGDVWTNEDPDTGSTTFISLKGGREP